MKRALLTNVCWAGAGALSEVGTPARQQAHSSSSNNNNGSCTSCTIDGPQGRLPGCLVQWSELYSACQVLGCATLQWAADTHSALFLLCRRLVALGGTLPLCLAVSRRQQRRLLRQRPHLSSSSLRRQRSLHHSKPHRRRSSSRPWQRRPQSSQPSRSRSRPRQPSQPSQQNRPSLQQRRKQPRLATTT